MKRIYICKYCGRTITLFTYNRTSNLVSLVDHVMIKHCDKIPEIGGIYLSDIPKECFVIEEGENNGYGCSKTEQNLTDMHTDFA